MVDLENDSVPFLNRATVSGTDLVIVFKADAKFKPLDETTRPIAVTPFVMTRDGEKFAVGAHWAGNVIHPYKINEDESYTWEFDEDSRDYLNCWRAMKVLDLAPMVDTDFAKGALRLVKGHYGPDYRPGRIFVNYPGVVPVMNRLFTVVGGLNKMDEVFREVVMSNPTEEELRNANQTAGRFGVTMRRV